MTLAVTPDAVIEHSDHVLVGDGGVVHWIVTSAPENSLLPPEQTLVELASGMTGRRRVEYLSDLTLYRKASS